MSDTPRMNLALRRAQEDCTESYLVTEGLKLERELNAANERIKRLEEALTEKRDKAEQRYIEEQNDGDGISVASTRAYYLALKEALIEVDKAKEAKP